MTVNVSSLDTAPDTLPWWRAMSTLTVEQAQAISSMDNNNTADYKQLSASLGGVLRQYNDLKLVVGSIPTTETQNSQVSNFGAPSTAYVTIATHTFVVPDGKSAVSAFAELDCTPGNAAADPHSRTRVVVNGNVSVAPATPTGGTASSYVSLGVAFPLKAGQTFNILYQFAADVSNIPASVANVANCNSLVVWT